ncbi:MAG TPA: PQQ-binding-like beta-propeller repeat protein [Bryobacteraceae bacterium]|nr:PQQ-binding-like beta-propeller repeat protein [Bryobacteraceae bacterium]
MSGCVAAKSILISLVALVFSSVADADWLTFGGDSQRTGWAKGESILNKDNAATLEVKWTIQLDNMPKELTSLATPVVVDQVKTAHGIKEFVIVAGSSNDLYAVDADSGKLVWKKTFSTSGSPSRAPSTLCPFAVNATPAVETGRTKTVYTIASDGNLHALSAEDGEERFPPVQFVPAFSKNWSLNLFGGTVYTAISQGCNGVPSGVYSLDLKVPEHPVQSFQAGRPGIWGRAGVAISPAGKVFAETGDGIYDPAAGQFADTFLALSAKDLKLADSYTPSNREWLTRKDLDMGCITPVVFRFKGKEFVAGAGKEGRLFLLDAGSIGGETHRKPLFRSELLTNEEANYSGHGFWGAFASFEDAKGVRWIYAPAWGPPHPAAAPSFPISNGGAPNGSIMAFRLEFKDNSPVLSPVWISRDLNVPEPPIVANGVVYVLSSGEDVMQYRTGTAERLRGSRKATLHALDAETGKELFGSEPLSSFTHFGGLALSNGRIFVATYDGHVYAFGPKQEDR